MKKSWNVSKYLMITVDPLHIGVGGQRLGRVDATVVRDPISNVPKIPGTSISGALKFFFDLALRNNGKNNICSSTRGSDKSNDHNRSECPVCAAFGYTTDKLSMQGILQFSDGNLLAYPINTIAGPVWITTAGRLCDLCGLGDGMEKSPEEYIPVVPDSTVFKEKNVVRPTLNFGWIIMESSKESAPVSKAELEKLNIPARYVDRMVIVPEYVFSNLVNSNMEVRTSVVIDPETGAAKGGGLFTYEAVVKGALFIFELTENDYAAIWSKVKHDKKGASATEMLETNAFPGVEAVGIGGMTTRGFGRLHIEKMGE